MSAPRPVLAVDARREGGRVHYRVDLVNRGDAEYRHTLPTSRKVDVQAVTSDGSVVHDPSAGLMFLQVLTPLSVAPRERVTLIEDAFDAPASRVTIRARLPGSDVAGEATA